jgi:hypothetical protein
LPILRASYYNFLQRPSITENHLQVHTARGFISPLHCSLLFTCSSVYLSLCRCNNSAFRTWEELGNDSEAFAHTHIGRAQYCLPHLYSTVTSSRTRVLVPRAAPRGTVQVHSHRVTCLKMYIISELAAALFLCTTLSRASYIPQTPVNTENSISTMSTPSGFRNVAYFVNWVRSFTNV